MDNKENKNIKKNKVLKLTALLGLFLLVFGVSYALFSVVLEGTKKNRITTANFGLILTDKNGVSVVLADVVNNTSSKSQLMKVTLTLLDKSGNKIVDMNGIIPALDPGEKTQLNMGAGSGYANAYDFKVEE